VRETSLSWYWTQLIHLLIWVSELQERHRAVGAIRLIHLSVLRDRKTSSTQNITLTFPPGPEGRPRYGIQMSLEFAYLESTLH
jgi:hypothetical protein